MWHASNPSDMRARHRMLVSCITPLTSHVLPYRVIVSVVVVVVVMSVTCAAAHTNARGAHAALSRMVAWSSVAGARARDLV